MLLIFVKIKNNSLSIFCKLNIRLLAKYFLPLYSALISIGPFTRNVEQTLDIFQRRRRFDKLQLHCIVSPKKKIYSLKRRFGRGIICKYALWMYSAPGRSSLDALKASSSHALRPALATLLISYIPCENYLAEFTLFRGNAPCKIMILPYTVQ